MLNQFKHLRTWGKNNFQRLKFGYNNNPDSPVRNPEVHILGPQGNRRFTGCLGANSQSLWTYEWSSDGGNQGAKSSETGCRHVCHDSVDGRNPAPPGMYKSL